MTDFLKEACEIHSEAKFPDCRDGTSPNVPTVKDMLIRYGITRDALDELKSDEIQEKIWATSAYVNYVTDLALNTENTIRRTNYWREANTLMFVIEPLLHEYINKKEKERHEITA